MWITYELILSKDSKVIKSRAVSDFLFVFCCLININDRQQQVNKTAGPLRPSPIYWNTSGFQPTVYIYLTHNWLCLCEYSTRWAFWHNCVCIWQLKCNKTQKRSEFAIACCLRQITLFNITHVPLFIFSFLHVSLSLLGAYNFLCSTVLRRYIYDRHFKCKSVWFVFHLFYHSTGKQKWCIWSLIK